MHEPTGNRSVVSTSVGSVVSVRRRQAAHHTDEADEHHHHDHRPVPGPPAPGASGHARPMLRSPVRGREPPQVDPVQGWTAATTGRDPRRRPRRRSPVVGRPAGRVPQHLPGRVELTHLELGTGGRLGVGVHQPVGVHLEGTLGVRAADLVVARRRAHTQDAVVISRRSTPSSSAPRLPGRAEPGGGAGRRSDSAGGVTAGPATGQEEHQPAHSHEARTEQHEAAGGVGTGDRQRGAVVGGAVVVVTTPCPTISTFEATEPLGHSTVMVKVPSVAKASGSGKVTSMLPSASSGSDVADPRNSSSMKKSNSAPGGRNWPPMMWISPSSIGTTGGSSTNPQSWG